MVEKAVFSWKKIQGGFYFLVKTGMIIHMQYRDAFASFYEK